MQGYPYEDKEEEGGKKKKKNLFVEEKRKSSLVLVSWMSPGEHFIAYMYATYCFSRWETKTKDQKLMSMKD